MKHNELTEQLMQLQALCNYEGTSAAIHDAIVGIICAAERQAASIAGLEAENAELRKSFEQTPFFLYDPEDGLSEFKTLAERDEAASDQIQEYLGDGWDESVTNIVAGIITAKTQQVDLTPRPEDLDEEGCDKDGRYWSDDWDYMCNYKLIPVTDCSENITRFEKVVSAGQIQPNDHLILHTKEGIITAKANEIIRPGVTDDSDGEEVIYNRKKNHYFITNLVISGQSWVKEVYIAKPQEKTK